MVILSLGSNIGDRLKNLVEAIKSLQIFHNTEESNSFSNSTRIQIIKISSTYETEPVGDYKDQEKFYNIIIQIKTKLNPEELLIVVNRIEKDLGRKRTLINSPRIIDIDIIYYNDMIVKTKNLIIPHVEYKNRKFVLIPLLEIVPSFIDATSGEGIKFLISNCTDKTKIVKLNI